MDWEEQFNADVKRAEDRAREFLPEGQTNYPCLAGGLQSCLFAAYVKIGSLEAKLKEGDNGSEP